MQIWLYALLAVALVICVISLVASVNLMKKQEQKELDKGVNAFSTKHHILGNRMLLTYVLFPVTVVLLSLIVLYYLK
ncbi:hypothetical protein MJA45_13840 [Paenibacillus aurantius]|uniref:Uncharacterized protein n=1 Tax=Paenibacillus aurantius TaxID=2918900 RepID=A0AA96RHI1_9BACL|nr:hypothetical protein [Paenibacillus aurantius]WNQ14052.1 hypothetical protein MJA45_13840 [Paenibacillus aurantius]